MVVEVVTILLVLALVVVEVLEVGVGMKKMIGVLKPS